LSTIIVSVIEQEEPFFIAYAVVNRNVNNKSHPEAVRPFLPEIQEFVRHNHIDVLHEIGRYVPLDFEIHGH